MNFKKNFTLGPIVLVVLILSGTSSLAFGQEVCAGLFTPSSQSPPPPRPHSHSHSHSLPFDTVTVDGVKPTAFQRLKNKLSFHKNPLSAFEARSRYYSFFHEIFADVDPVHLSQAQTRFKWLPFGEYGHTYMSTHQISINKNLKNHPLYPVIHAHELSHVYDLETAQVSSQVRDFEQVLDSEIRAHDRELVAALTLFTREELQTIKTSEKDPYIRDKIDFIIKYGSEPESYITLTLISNYQNIVAKVTETNNVLRQGLLIKRRVRSVLMSRETKPPKPPLMRSEYDRPSF